MLKQLLRYFCDWYGIGLPKLVCTLLFSTAAIDQRYCKVPLVPNRGMTSWIAVCTHVHSLMRVQTCGCGVCTEVYRDAHTDVGALMWFIDVGCLSALMLGR